MNLRTPIRILTSRADRIGDLILTLPAIAHLKEHSKGHITLHCAEYTRDIAELAVYNGICDDYICSSKDLDGSYDFGIAYFHKPGLKGLFKSAGCGFSIGPRPKISAMWSYSKSFAQHRSKVKKSEMQYNLDLSNHLVKKLGVPGAKFKGLPKLKIPDSWTCSTESPDMIVNLSNGGSAKNWSLSQYTDWVQKNAPTKRVDFLIVGNDAIEREKLLEKWDGFNENLHQKVGAFVSLKELMVYVSKTKFMLSSSTGALHVAHALGVDCLGVYPTKQVESFKRWRPDGYWHEAELRFVEI